MSNKTLILFRGLPGSGKSTATQVLKSELEATGLFVKVIESDQWRTNQAGEYIYKGHQNGLAHSWCFAEMVRHLDILNYDAVIIANTFITQKECQRYIDWAQENKVVLEIREPSVPWRYNAEECFKRGTHEVPLEAIERMRSKWDEEIQL